MGTRSYIGIENLDSTITFVYCHFDGYPSGVGKEVLEMSIDEVRALISEGDMSSIGEPYSARGENWDDIKPETVANAEAFIEKFTNSGCDYAYLVDKRGETLYARRDNRRFTSLLAHLQKVYDEKGE